MSEFEHQECNVCGNERVTVYEGQLVQHWPLNGGHFSCPGGKDAGVDDRTDHPFKNLYDKL